MCKTSLVISVATLLFCLSGQTIADLTPPVDSGPSLSLRDPALSARLADPVAQLYSAVWAGAIDDVGSLIDNVPDINAGDQIGNTPLHVVVMSKSASPEIITLLIEQGADPDAKNEEGLTPADLAAHYLRHDVLNLLVEKGAAVSSLHMAAYLGRKDQVEGFVDNGVAVDDRDSVGRTALFYAACAGHNAVAECLIAKGADIEARQGNSRQTPLYGAAVCGHEAMTQLLLDRGADINAVDAMEQTPLHYACLTGSANTAALLIAKGADVQKLDQTGRSVLHWAVAVGSPRLAALALSKGADINALDRDGQTPLDIAVYRGSQETVDLLVAGGARVSSLYTGALLGDMEQLKTLVAQGADVNAKADKGATALHNAALAGQQQAVEYLLGQGAQIDAANEGGLTPLHNAVLAGRRNVVQYLTGKGASIGAQTSDGYTVLHLAVLRRDAKMAELLITLGADADVKDANGMTALMLAEQAASQEIIKALK